MCPTTASLLHNKNLKLEYEYMILLVACIPLSGCFALR